MIYLCSVVVRGQLGSIEIVELTADDLLTEEQAKFAATSMVQQIEGTDDVQCIKVEIKDSH
jgi:hypothetical protein